jgi:hypothetical protein
MGGDEEKNRVATEDEQPLHPVVKLLRLGDGFKPYSESHHFGYFHVWIPPLGCDLIVELDSSEGAPPQIIAHVAKKQIAKVDGRRMRIPLGKLHGRIDLTTRPGKAGVRVSMKWEGWAQDLDGTPIIPWNFWYFPYAIPTYWDGKDVQLSATNKYDLVVGNPPAPPPRSPPKPGEPVPPTPTASAEHWERELHSNWKRDHEPWEGHCDPAAFASVIFKQPPAIKPYNGQIFHQRELELLATEWAGVHLEKEEPWNFGVGTPSFKMVPKEKRTPEDQRKVTIPPDSRAVHLLSPNEMGENLPPSQRSSEKAREKLEQLLYTRYMSLIAKLADKDYYEPQVREQSKALSNRREEISRAFGRGALDLVNYIVGEWSSEDRRPVLGNFGSDPSATRPTVDNHAVALARVSVVDSLASSPSGTADPREVDVALEMFINLDEEADGTNPPGQDPGRGHPAEVKNGRVVEVPGFHKRCVYLFRFDFNTSRFKWLSADIDGSVAYAPVKLGSPVASPKATVTNYGSGNPVIEADIFSLVTLHKRYQ